MSSSVIIKLKVMPTLPKASRLSPRLRTLIDVANALPPNEQPLRGIHAIVLKSEILRKVGETGTRVSLDERKRRLELLEYWRKRVRELPAVVRAYLGPVTSVTCITINDRWEEALKTRDVLQHLAGIGSSPYKQASLRWLLQRQSARLVSIEFEEKSPAGMKPQVILKFHLTRIVEALNGVDASRIRMCKNEKCKKLFWAFKYNADYCNRKCGNAVRNREFRKST
jgi:hypothetical protein